jgi:hypothetical protein
MLEQVILLDQALKVSSILALAIIEKKSQVDNSIAVNEQCLYKTFSLSRRIRCHQ